MAKKSQSRAKKKKAAANSGAARANTAKKPARPFPPVTLKRALVIALEIKDKNAGNTWATEDVANAVGMSPKTNDFYYLTAASRDFGLTEGTRNTKEISLTDLGRRTVYAGSSEEEQKCKREAFARIDIFKKVLEYYKGSNLPEMKYLGNTLEREFGLDPEYHEEFSKLFRENCEYLGITEGSNVDDGTDAEASDDGRRATVTMGEPRDKSKLTAFVIMPFTEKGGDRPTGFFGEVLRSLFTPAGVAAGFRVETAKRQGSDLIQSTIINDLLDADLVVADLTDHNPNVLFELGIRMAEGKPVALVKATGTGRIFDVDNMLRVFEYNSNLWRTTIETDLPELTEHIKATWANKAQDRSYMQILRSASSDGGRS